MEWQVRKVVYSEAPHVGKHTTKIEGWRGPTIIVPALWDRTIGL